MIVSQWNFGDMPLTIQRRCSFDFVQISYIKKIHNFFFFENTYTEKQIEQ